MGENNGLFGQAQTAINAPLTGHGYELLPVGHLAQCADDYDDEDSRPPADPIGRGGLPADRGQLDAMLCNLCDRLIAAGGRALGGKAIIYELRLPCTRSLRLLVAYGHVHHKLRAIVGLPGEGYLWGEHRPGIYEKVANMSRQMGRGFFFNATLYGKGRPAVEAAQLLLDFVGDGRVNQRSRHGDELSAMVAAEGLTIEDVLGSIFETLTQTETGKATLTRLGTKHRQFLLTGEELAAMQTQMIAAQDQFRIAMDMMAKLRPTG